MFKECLNDLPYVSSIADDCYPNIRFYYDNRDKNIFDDSFLTTMRIILANRIEKRIDLVLLNKDVSNYTHLNDEGFIDSVTNSGLTYEESYERLYVINFDGYRESIIDSCFNKLDSLEPCFNGFKEVNDLKAFFEQKKIAKCRFFINAEQKITVIFVKRLTQRVNHMLQSLLPRYLKWDFENNPISETEKELFRSLTYKTAGEYIEIVNSLAKQQNFEEIKIKNLLNDFDKRIFESQIDDVSRKISDYESRVEQLYRQVGDCISHIDRLTTERFGLTMRKDSSDSNELMDYFLCNKNVDLVSVNDNRIEFIVTTYINNFDFDNYEAMIQNENSILYRYGTNGYFVNENLENRRILLKALFDEQTLKLKVCAAYKLQSGRGDAYANGLDGYSFPNKYINHLPNQHIQRYHCLGDNEREIIKALRKGDYICAIEQCISSAGNMNMADTAVLPHFIQEIFGEETSKIIELPDGSSLTPQEAVEWLKEQED